MDSYKANGIWKEINIGMNWYLPKQNIKWELINYEFHEQKLKYQKKTDCKTKGKKKTSKTASTAQNQRNTWFLLPACSGSVFGIYTFAI